MDRAEQTGDPPPEPTVREIGLDEALVLAVECQRNGRFEDAASLYRKILELVPGHPAATHYSGILAQQQGRLEEATALLEESLALDPTQADWHANLAINLQARDMFDEAIAACRRAIEVDPGHANALSNLGALLRAKGRVEEAEEAYRAAIRLNPDHIAAYMNLGILLAALRRTQEAVWCYCKVTTLNAHYPPARRMLALAHIMVGEVDKARRIYEESLAQDPDDPVAKHMLAACSGAEMPARASNECVSTLFDGFAANFETRLAQLDYRAPALVECIAGIVRGPGGEGARRAGRRLRHRPLWKAPLAVCTAADRGGPLNRHAAAGRPEGGVRRVVPRRADGLPARAPRPVRRDRLG